MGTIKERMSSWKKRTTTAEWPDQLAWIVTDSKTNSKSDPALPSPSRSTIAFLQYTSGSTSSPKGVMITHGNLAHNLTMITSELAAGDDTVVVSWLPQYHDMGLIGSYLGCLYCGGSGYYLSPLSFLQRPMLWIEAVSKYRGTHLQAPNFSFKLTARKYAASNNLNLSSVRHIINAAEPVDEAAMEAFYDTFCPLGLKRGVIFPTYGLAEQTVFVCTGGSQRLSVDKKSLEVDGRVELVEATGAPDKVSRMIGCGIAPESIDIQIVDPESTKLLSEGHVGEIWIRSPSKAAGYYQQPEESASDFSAKPADSTDEYLRTGDLGFIHEKEVFICGRLKDLIIVGGRNYYPQDIEATAEATGGDLIRLGCSAAFTINPTGEGNEEVALVMEVKDVDVSEPKRTKLCSDIRAAVNTEHSLGLVEVVLLAPRSVPKTSSGKIARAWCRKGYNAGTLKSLYRKHFKVDGIAPMELEDANGYAPSQSRNKLSAEEVRALPKGEIMKKLVTDVSQVGSIAASDVVRDAPLVTMMDSLTLSQFKGMLEQRYSVRMSDEYLFRESTTLNKLVEVVKLGHAPDDGDGAGTTIETSTGTAGGLAGALGCPPGVVCTIM